MRKLFLLAFCALTLYACNPVEEKMQVNVHGTEWTWNNGTIVVKSPEREQGQKSVLGLSVPKMEIVALMHLIE